MSALLIFPDALSILPDSRYRQDEAAASSLLETACSEQRARFRALQLLADYLTRTTDHKRHLLERERRALQDLYEAVWIELECAFPLTLVRAARLQVEIPEEICGATPAAQLLLL